MSLGFLFPRYEGEFPTFRDEVRRLAVVGLRVIGAICIGAPLAWYVLGVFVLPSLPNHSMVLTDLLQAAVGTIVVVISFQKWVAPHARAFGVFTGALVATIQTSGMLMATEFHETVLQTRPEQHFPTIISIVLPVGIVAIPMKPMHTLGLGASIVSIFALVAIVLREGARPTGWEVFPMLQSVMLLAIFTLLTAVLYRQRAEAFLARRRAEESFAELSKAQASLLVEKNAASQSRFAAAMSHELNTPLGSLASAFDTLVKLLERFDERLATDPRHKQVLDDAVTSGQSSFDRLTEISDRMRHLTNLDKAESQQVDLNVLCEDVVEFLSPELDRVEVLLETTPVPKLQCRPQQIGAVLSNLLRNAAAAVDERGCIQVSTAHVGDEVAVEVRDNGRGIERDALETLFEPEFRVDGDRVATSNWGLFVSRSIVTEHRGRLLIESEPGAGTTATMRLPL